MHTIKLTASLDIISRALDQDRDAVINGIKKALDAKVQALECDLSATAPEYHAAVQEGHTQAVRQFTEAIREVFYPNMPF